jgi:hypothetical protein
VFVKNAQFCAIRVRLLAAGSSPIAAGRSRSLSSGTTSEASPPSRAAVSWRLADGVSPRS